MSTEHQNSQPATPPPRRRLPRFDLSLTQLIATGLAAITATVAASFLGIAGTVAGAALFSVLMAVGKELYSQSLRSGRDRVREAVPVIVGRPGHTASVTVERASADGDAAVVPTTAEDLVQAGAAPELPSTPLLPSVIWKRVGFATLSVFVVVLAAVTVVELVAGRPLSDVVRGDSGQGTSFFGNQQVRTRTVTPPAPTTTVTVTPKVVVTTPTVTQTAPKATKTETPTGTTTVTPTTTPTTPGSSSATVPPTATTSAR